MLINRGAGVIEDVEKDTKNWFLGMEKVMSLRKTNTM
jgi:hypothetical protein